MRLHNTLQVAVNCETNHNILGFELAMNNVTSPQPHPFAPPHGNLYSMQEACTLTGIEAARIRYIEWEFKELFGALESVAFDDRALALLRRIHHLMFEKGESINAIRSEISPTRFKAIAVTSGKGGVGKTTVSVNLAIALARRGLRTLVFDADMGLGNVHVFAGISPRGTVLDVVEGRADGASVLSPGPENISVLCGGSGNAKLADADMGMLDRLGREVARIASDFDILLIDTGAGISNQVTHFLAMADEVAVVTTPNIAATLDAYGIIKVVRERAMSGRISLLVNQADDERQSEAVQTRIRDCASRFLQYSPASLGYLFRDRVVEESNQQRRPLLISNPDHENSRRIVRIAETLCAPAADSDSAREPITLAPVCFA